MRKIIFINLLLFLVISSCEKEQENNVRVTRVDQSPNTDTLKNISIVENILSIEEFMIRIANSEVTYNEEEFKHHIGFIKKEPIFLTDKSKVFLLFKEEENVLRALPYSMKAGIYPLTVSDNFYILKERSNSSSFVTCDVLKEQCQIIKYNKVLTNVEFSQDSDELYLSSSYSGDKIHVLTGLSSTPVISQLPIDGEVISSFGGKIYYSKEADPNIPYPNVDIYEYDISTKANKIILEDFGEDLTIVEEVGGEVYIFGDANYNGRFSLFVSRKNSSLREISISDYSGLFSYFSYKSNKFVLFDPETLEITSIDPINLEISK